MLRYFSESEEVDVQMTWGPPLQCIYLRFYGGGRQAALSTETLLEVKVAWGWGDEVVRKRVLSGGCNRTWH